MAASKFELDANVREDRGKGASRRLRYRDSVPAILYGGGEGAVALTLDHKKVNMALAHEAFYSHILTLTVEGRAEKVVLKDLQRHPTKPRILHLDFQRIRHDQKLHMNIPLHFLGDKVAPGVKEGGVVSRLINDVEVSCLPADLPEYIEVDISQLALNETLHLSNLSLPSGVSLVAFAHGVEGHDLPIVSIHVPQIEEPTEVAASDAPQGEAGEEGEKGGEKGEKGAAPSATSGEGNK